MQLDVYKGDTFIWIEEYPHQIRGMEQRHLNPKKLGEWEPHEPSEKYQYLFLQDIREKLEAIGFEIVEGSGMKTVTLEWGVLHMVQIRLFVSPEACDEWIRADNVVGAEIVQITK
ncbi:MAG: hypothetical protein IT435_02395 [Phycisphaerales bacterium]|nr:hypothetical protein [Phycisphaerales bacterium]